jgi:PAS domain S-box-containing protein
MAISPVFRDTISGKPVFVMAMPVLKNGAIKGVLCTEFDLIALNDKFIDKIKFGQSGNAFIVDNRDGRILAHPDLSTILKENMNNGVQGREMLNTDKGYLHIDSPPGISQSKRLVVYDVLKELNWKIAIGADTEELNAPIIRIRNINFIITITIICVACLIIYLVTKTTIIRPMQRLQTSAERLSHGSLDHPIDVGRNDELGSLAQSFTVMRDAIKLQMQELKEAEKKYRDIFENAIEGIFQLTIDGQFISANQAMAIIFGHDSPEELIASVSNITDQFHHPTENKNALFEGLKERGLVAGIERRYKRKDGSSFWGYESVRAVYDEKGSLLHYDGSLIDITERKKAEAAVKESHERLLTVLNSLNAIVYVADMKTYEVLFINKYTHDFFGNIEGKICWQTLQAGQTGPCSFCTNDKLLNPDGKPAGVYSWEFKNTFNNKWYYIQDRAVQWVDGRIVRMEIATDITDRKQVEEILQKSHKELEERVEERTLELQKTHSQLLHAEKLSAVGRLSASIAHEFNNPLQGILSVIKGIKRRTELDDADAELVNMAIRECTRMKDFIKDLQDFNRPTSGRPEPSDIHEVIDSTLLLTKKDLETRKITVEKDYDVNLPLIQVVVDQIKQVLLNLLNNAADACEGGGIIRISTRVQGGSLLLRVQDNGKGIAQEHCDHIFEPFFTTKPEVKGTGLGLSVSYGIIKRHGGTIEVKSKPDKGTTFTITLPVAGGSNAEQIDSTG